MQSALHRVACRFAIHATPRSRELGMNATWDECDEWIDCVGMPSVRLDMPVAKHGRRNRCGGRLEQGREEEAPRKAAHSKQQPNGGSNEHKSLASFQLGLRSLYVTALARFLRRVAHIPWSGGIEAAEEKQRN